VIITGHEENVLFSPWWWLADRLVNCCQASASAGASGRCDVMVVAPRMLRNKNKSQLNNQLDMISAAAGGRAGRRQVGRASRAAPRAPYGRSASGAARLLPGTGESERCHGCLLASDETAARGLLAINRKVIIRRDAIMGLGILVRPASPRR